MRDEAAIAREAALDGFYVLRTPVSPETLDAAAIVLAFRALGSIDLEVRPCTLPLPAGRGRTSLGMLA